MPRSRSSRPVRRVLLAVLAALAIAGVGSLSGLLLGGGPGTRARAASTESPGGSGVSTSGHPSPVASPGSSTGRFSSAGPAPSGGSPSADNPIPVFAYFYQWYTASSWNRAKIDYPLIGRYSSDDLHVLQTQVKQAKAAGIDGFFTSWKSTTALNHRLEMLLQVAHADDFQVGIVYEALDFSRNPLPVSTVEHDLTYLLSQWGPQLTIPEYGRPVIVWTGTDKYTTAEVAAVRAAIGTRAYLLASSHSVSGYQRIANLVDGEAYYWSSADPTSAATTSKLNAMSAAVHAHGGLWFAPAAGGFDGRPLGGSRVITRNQGDTLVTSLNGAFASSPDAVAVISWNEWSENTYIEPSQKYGTQELVALTQYLAQRGRALPTAVGAADSSQGSTTSSWTGARAAATLGLLAVVVIPGLSLAARRRNVAAPLQEADSVTRAKPHRLRQESRSVTRTRQHRPRHRH